MLSWILLIVVLAALVVIGTWAFGRIFGRGEILRPADESKTVIAENRAALERGDFSAITFELVPRGYRQDQVDDLLAEVERRRQPAKDYN